MNRRNVCFIVMIIGVFWLFSKALAINDDSLTAALEKEIKAIMNEENVSFIEGTRIYVRKYSQHNYRESPISNYENVIMNIYNASQGKGEKEVLLCGEIAYTMAHILSKFGYEFHFIRMGYVLGGHKATQERYLDHVVLEVKNKKNDKYELHDPDYNLHYVKSDDTSMTPLSVEEMYLNKDIDQAVIPVRGQVSGKQLPTEKTIIRNVCGRSILQSAIFRCRRRSVPWGALFQCSAVGPG